jgi:quercetin dioxygenase-like cupin family protein
MRSKKSFAVLGERVDVLLSSEESGGQVAVALQTTGPGGGPPPHKHSREDETFTVLEGEYEFLSDGQWTRNLPGDSVFAPRGHVHTYRNSGSEPAKLLVHITPGGFEKFLEQLSAFSVPQALPQIIALGEEFGVTFVLGPPAAG